MNYQCQIPIHNQQKIIKICLATQCQDNRVCCQICQLELHKDHFEQLADLDSLMEFIKTQGKKEDIVSANVAYVLQKLINVQKNFEVLMKLITQEIKRLYSFCLPQYCRNLENKYNLQAEKMGNQQWNQLAKDMLSRVEIKNGDLIEKDVNQLGQPHQLFIEIFSQQMTKINTEVHRIQQKIDPNQFMQLTVSHELEGHTNDVTRIDICEARNLLVSSSTDKTVKLWNLQNFKLINTFKDTKMVFDAVFSSNGNLIAYGGGSKIISLIDISDLDKQDIVSELKGHSNDIGGLTFSNNSMYLISGSSDNSVRVWDVNVKSELFKLTTKCAVIGVAINNDNTLIASNLYNGKINIWNFKDQKLLLTQQSDVSGIGMQFSNDQQMLISCGKNGVIKMWSLAYLGQGKLSLIRKLYLSDKITYSISVTYDSRFIISHCGQERKVKVMDTFTGKIIFYYDIKGDSFFGVVAMTRKADIIANTNSNGKSITVWKKK